MANMPQYNYSIPNRIVPGLPQNFTNQTMTTHNDLDRVMLAKPQILEAYVRHQLESTGMLSEIIAHFGNNNIMGFANGAAYSGRNGEMSGELIGKNMKVLDHYQYTWRGKAPDGFVYKLTRAVNNTAVTTLGGIEFVVYLNKDLVSPNDVFLLADQKTNLKVVRVNQSGANPNECAVTMRLLTSFQGAGEYVQQKLLDKGAELTRAYNQQSSKSSFGSRTQVKFGEWYTNYLSTIRYEWDMTGMASNMKIQADQVKWLVYTDENGLQYPYYTNVLQYNMMREMLKGIDNMLFIGKRDITPDGKFRRDEKGFEFVSGDGLYYQSQSRYRRSYTVFNEYMIEDVLNKASEDNNGENPTLLCMGGRTFRTNFDRLMRNAFRANPRDLFWSGTKAVDGLEGLNGAMGFKSNFKVYATAAGTFVVGETNYFDRKSNAKLMLSDGTDYNSNRAIIVNMGQNIYGQNYELPFQLVTMKNSWMRRAKQATIADTVNGYGAPEDVVSEHLMCRAGIAAYNPNSIMEFYKDVNS